MMISVNNLKKSYGSRTVVDDLTLSIPKGTVFGFLGENGAGKTTTMKMMVGITVPEKGTVEINGKNVLLRSTREQFGFMPEAPYMYDRLTGLEFLEFCGGFFTKRKSRKDCLVLIKEAGIYEARDRAISTYSKGMKQRLGFASTLVNDPECIFLDEPLDGLDPIGRRALKKTLLNLKAAGKTVFFNSHILSDIEQICDEIGVLHQGKLLYVGSVKEFCDGMSLEDRFVMTIDKQS